MTDYNIRIGEEKDLFTVLERIKMTDYNTFVYRVGEDKDD